MVWNRPDASTDPQPDPLAAFSGCFTCPCCGSISYSPGPVCSSCIAAGCESRPGRVDGDMGYWECQRPDADELDDDTVEFEFDPTAAEPGHVQVHAERSRDGWVVIEFIELTEGELSGAHLGPDAEGAQADAAARKEAS